jgi:hypothetical protein
LVEEMKSLNIDYGYYDEKQKEYDAKRAAEQM